MNLRYILGLPGSGKTYLCLSEMLAAGGGNIIYLVPEQYTLQSERSIVARSPGGATSISVLSFSRLAFRLFSRTGAPPGKYLDNVGKVMLLRKITADLRGELTFYGRSADKPGFINGLCDTISEFHKGRVTQEGLQSAMESAQTETLKRKLADLSLILRRYTETIKNNYFSPEEMINFLPNKITDTDELKGSLVWVDGFHGFTRQEMDALLCIIQKAESVTVSMSVDADATAFPDLRPYDFFYETKRSVNEITVKSVKKGSVIGPVAFLDYKSNEALYFLRQNFFISKRQHYSKPAPEICVQQAYDREIEVECAAKRIIALLREDGLRYRDIAVLSGDIGTYEKKIKRVFSLYGIPFFIDIRVDIMTHPLVELIRAAIESAAKRMPYEGVMRFLRTDMTGININDVDALENYLLGYGIKGYQWVKSWAFGEGAEQAEALRVRVLDALGPFTDGLYVKKASVREFSERLFKMLDRLNVTVTLDRWIGEMIAAGDNETARRHSQIWSIICGVFDKLVETLGGSEVSAAEFGKILDAGLSATDMGIIPPSVDQVTVGDLTRSRLPDLKALIVLGANEGMMPKPAMDSGFFSDEERLFLHERGIEAGHDGKRKYSEDRFMSYAAMAKPSGSLYLSFSRFDGGKELKPAGCVDTILKLFPDAYRDAAPEDIGPARPMLARMGALMRGHMGGAEMPPEMKDAYGLLKGREMYGEALGKMESAITYDGGRRGLSEQAPRLLYGRELITGASRLERFAECPFAYFMSYNLKARERRLYAVDQLDTGNLFHDVLARFTRKLSEAGESWHGLTRERIDALTDECMEELSASIPVFYSTERYKYILSRVRRICKRSIWALAEHIKRGMFEPYGAEISFNGASPITGIEVSLKGEMKIILTGRIDRVDIYDSGGKRYVKIIDYKSGNAKFSLSDVYFGTQLQLVLYMDALIKNGRELFGKNCDMEILPGGLFYFNINDPIIREPEDNGDIEKNILDCFRMSGLVLGDEVVVDAMDGGLKGDSAVIPVSVLKSGAGFTARSSVMSAEEFGNLRISVDERISDISRDILSGNISAFPYKKGAATACDYCFFGGVCAFEADERPGKYNVVRAR